MRLYVPGLSKSVSQFITKCSIGYETTTKTAAMFKNLKLKLNKNDNTGLVYKTNCN